MGREQTTLRLPADLLEALRREANERGMSLNAVAVWALTAFVDRWRKSDPDFFQTLQYAAE
jgi:predicted HicB family RNase H-like nuclease